MQQQQRAEQVQHATPPCRDPAWWLTCSTLLAVGIGSTACSAWMPSMDWEGRPPRPTGTRGPLLVSRACLAWGGAVSKGTCEERMGARGGGRSEGHSRTPQTNQPSRCPQRTPFHRTLTHLRSRLEASDVVVGRRAGQAALLGEGRGAKGGECAHCPRSQGVHRAAWPAGMHRSRTGWEGLGAGADPALSVHAVPGAADATARAISRWPCGRAV